MPFTLDTFTHLFDWEKDPQRQVKIVNARLEAEFDGIDTGYQRVRPTITSPMPSSPTWRPIRSRAAMPEPPAFRSISIMLR